MRDMDVGNISGRGRDARLVDDACGVIDVEFDAAGVSSITDFSFIDLVDGGVEAERMSF